MIMGVLPDMRDAEVKAVRDAMLAASEEWLKGHADHLGDVIRVELPGDTSVEWPRGEIVLERLVCRRCAGTRGGVHVFAIKV